MVRQDNGPSVITFELVAWTMRAGDVVAGDTIIIEPTGGVLEVRGVRTAAGRVRIRASVRARSRREVVWELPADAVVYREDPGHPW